MARVLPFLAIAVAMAATGCKRLRLSHAKSSDSSEADTSRIFDSLLSSRQADPDFDAKVAATAASSFATYAEFVADGTPAAALPADALTGGARLDADFPSLAAFMRISGTVIQDLSRDEVKAVVAVASGAAATVADLPTGAAAVKIALYLVHQNQLSGLALATPRPAPGPSVVGQPPPRGRSYLPNYSPGTQTPGPASQLPGVVPGSSLVIPANEAQNKASLLLASVGRSYQGLKSSADRASGSPGAALPPGVSSDKANRFCGTAKNGFNIYLSSDAVTTGTRCPSGSVRSGRPPVANAEANPRDDSPDNPLNPVDNLGDTAAEAAVPAADAGGSQ